MKVNMLSNKTAVLAVSLLLAMNTGASITSNIQGVLTKNLDLKEQTLSMMDRKVYGFDY